MASADGLRWPTTAASRSSGSIASSERGAPLATWAEPPLAARALGTRRPAGGDAAPSDRSLGESVLSAGGVALDLRLLRGDSRGLAGLATPHGTPQPSPGGGASAAMPAACRAASPPLARRCLPRALPEQLLPPALQSALAALRALPPPPPRGGGAALGAPPWSQVQLRALRVFLTQPLPPTAPATALQLALTVTDACGAPGGGRLFTLSLRTRAYLGAAAGDGGGGGCGAAGARDAGGSGGGDAQDGRDSSWLPLLFAAAAAAGGGAALGGGRGAPRLTAPHHPPTAPCCFHFSTCEEGAVLPAAGGGGGLVRSPRDDCQRRADTCLGSLRGDAQRRQFVLFDSAVAPAPARGAGWAHDAAPPSPQPPPQQQQQQQRAGSAPPRAAQPVSGGSSRAAGPPPSVRRGGRRRRGDLLGLPSLTHALARLLVVSGGGSGGEALLGGAPAAPPPALPPPPSGFPFLSRASRSGVGGSWRGAGGAALLSLGASVGATAAAEGGAAAANDALDNDAPGAPRPAPAAARRQLAVLLLLDAAEAPPTAAAAASCGAGAAPLLQLHAKRPSFGRALPPMLSQLFGGGGGGSVSGGGGGGGLPSLHLRLHSSPVAVAPSPLCDDEAGCGGREQQQQSLPPASQPAACLRTAPPSAPPHLVVSIPALVRMSQPAPAASLGSIPALRCAPPQSSSSPVAPLATRHSAAGSPPPPAYAASGVASSGRTGRQPSHPSAPQRPPVAVVPVSRLQPVRWVDGGRAGSGGADSGRAAGGAEGATRGDASGDAYGLADATRTVLSSRAVTSDDRLLLLRPVRVAAAVEAAVALEPIGGFCPRLDEDAGGSWRGGDGPLRGEDPLCAFRGDASSSSSSGHPSSQHPAVEWAGVCACGACNDAADGPTRGGAHPDEAECDEGAAAAAGERRGAGAACAVQPEPSCRAGNATTPQPQRWGAPAAVGSAAQQQHGCPGGPAHTLLAIVRLADCGRVAAAAHMAAAVAVPLAAARAAAPAAAPPRGSLRARYLVTLSHPLSPLQAMAAAIVHHEALHGRQPP